MLRIYSIANNLLGSAVASTTEDRDVMVTCLQLGAADYMMKPLRLPELRNLWARVYWWRRVSGPFLVALIRNNLADFLLMLPSLPASFHYSTRSKSCFWCRHPICSSSPRDLTPLRQNLLRNSQAAAWTQSGEQERTSRTSHA